MRTFIESISIPGQQTSGEFTCVTIGRPTEEISFVLLVLICRIFNVVDLSSWKEKIDDDLSNLEASSQPEHEYHAEDHDSSFSHHEQYKDGILTIGCCGR